MALLSNGSFEWGSRGWRPVNHASDVTISVIRDGTARSGAAFLRVASTVPGGSVAIDFPAGLTVEGIDSNGGPVSGAAGMATVGVSAWIRAKPGGPQVSGILTIWQLNAPGNDNHPDTAFTVDDNWTLLTNVIDLVPESGNFIPQMRVEFYISTVGPSLDIDTVIAA